MTCRSMILINNRNMSEDLVVILVSSMRQRVAMSSAFWEASSALLLVSWARRFAS